MRELNKKYRYWARPIGYVLWMFVMIVFFQNCGSEHQAGQPIEQTSTTGLDPAAFQALENDIATIFANRCTSCHSAGAATPQMPYLDNPAALHNATTYIVKGSPQTSPLYLSIIDGLMPKNGPNLVNTAPVEVIKIRDWIQFIP